MAEAPKRVTVRVTEHATLIVPGQCMPLGNHHFTRADIADGYRRALVKARKALQSFLDEEDDAAEMEMAIGEIGEALAKGDEG